MTCLRNSILFIMIFSLVLFSAETKEDEKAEAKAEVKAEKKEEKKEEKKTEKKEDEKAKAKAENEAKVKAEKEAKVKAEKEAKIKAKADKEAKAKVVKEAKVKAKADKEAKAKAAIEAKAKAKADKAAKIKADKEAKAKAAIEAKAKAKADKEAKIKADKEAKAKAKAEKEAKVKTEKEPKAKVETKEKAAPKEETAVEAQKEEKPAAEEPAKAEADKKTDTTDTKVDKKAKAKAEKEAKVKAAQEAKAKAAAEKEAKIKAQQEVKAKAAAEKEAKIKAAKEAKAKAAAEKKAKAKEDKESDEKTATKKVAKLKIKASHCDIAVYDLYTTFAADSEAALIISDRIRTELIKTGKFKIMERAEMMNVLGTQTFQFKDTCHSQSCLTGVGHLLGVNRVLYGSVAKVEDFFTIVLRLLNVPRGELVCTVTEDLEGGIKKVISQKASILIQRLLEDAGYISVEEKQAQKGHGTLHIDAEKVGAAIRIDGKDINKKTPATIDKLSAGEHRIVIGDKDWYGSKTITMEPDSTLMVTVPLTQKKGSLHLFTSPSKALAYVDGKEIGETPLTTKLFVGEHALQVEKEGYLSKEMKFNVNPLDVKNLTVDLEGVAHISVTASPDWADIVINGKTAGKGKVASYKVPAGAVSIEVEAAAHTFYETSVNIEPGMEKKIETTLEYLFGSLEVKAKPDEASLFLNDVEIGTAPYKNDRLWTGTYKLTLLEDTYNGITEDIVIKSNETITRNYVLKRNEAYRDSLRRQRWRAHGLRGVRRLVFSILAVACGAGGYYFETEAAKHKDDMKAAGNDYDAENDPESDFKAYKDRYEAARRLTDTNIIRRNLCIGAAGILGTGFFISIRF